MRRCLAIIYFLRLEMPPRLSWQLQGFGVPILVRHRFRVLRGRKRCVRVSTDTPEVRKMNKKVLTIAIVLVILAVVVAPAAAQLPTKDPLPKGNPWDIVWKWLTDLQTQITALSNRVTALETQVTNIPGPTHFGEPQIIPYSTAGGITGVTASTDGFVTCDVRSENKDEQVSVWGEWIINPYPLGDQTYVQVVFDTSPPFPNGYSRASIMMPVRKGQIWRISSDTQDADLFTIYWWPAAT